MALYEQYQSAIHIPPPAPSSASSHVVEGWNDGKECSNLLVLVSELYNFQVISSVLVFDIIRALLKGDLTEFQVELLLKLLRSKLYILTFLILTPNTFIDSGQQLRQDDPSALKDIINVVQGKIATGNNTIRYYLTSRPLPSP